ncbi:MAG: hypothetical protein JNM39_11350 [Bdellovibrionaceae bacterium]|nr:hypothetical protein [Pseudobdellovibrionaceae bacterium]
MVLFLLSQTGSLLSKSLRFAFLALICLHLAQPVLGTEPGDQVARKSSLRLTHLLFSAVIDRYLTEGLEKYRPDFLLHERYFRTFLTEWSLLLDKGETQSTQEVWKVISQRKTYLGFNYYIWQRALLSHFKTESWSNRIALGYTREAFLLSLLRSEEILDFNQRSLKIVELVSANLLNVTADQALALKILDSFLQHPDFHLRDFVRSIIGRSPAYLGVLETLQGIQNIYFFGRGGGTLLSGKAATFPGSKAADALYSRFVDTLHNKAIKFKEFGLKIWQMPVAAKAGAASIALHGAALAPRPSGASAIAKAEAVKREFYEDVFKDEPLTTPFLFNLSVNTASARSARLVKQIDFLTKQGPSLDETQNHSERPSKTEWLEEGRQNLNRWNSAVKNSKVLKIPSLAKYFIEGERLAGAWPKNVELAGIALHSRYDGMKARIVDKKIRDIETFRAELLSNELEVYRGKHPTLTGMLLDWGGNCVAQTLTIISLLIDLPQIVPSDQELGVYMSSNHMEAVLLGAKTIHFLVSGKILDRVEGMTVLRPQALLILAMSQLGYQSEVSEIDYYLSGKPQSSESKESGGLNFREFNLSLSQEKFPFRVHSDPNPPYAPDFASVSYAPSARSSSQSRPSGKDFWSSLWSESESKSSDPNVEVYSIRVENKNVEVRLSKSLEGTEMDRHRRNRSFQGSTVFMDGLVRTFYNEEIVFQRFERYEEDFTLPVPPTLSKIEAVLSLEKYQKLKSLPKDLWFFEFSTIALDSYARHLKLHKISDQALARAKSLSFLAEDVELFSQLSNSFANSFGRDTDYLINLARYLNQISPGANEDTENPEKDGVIYKVESLTAAIRRYIGVLKERHKTRPEFQIYLSRTESLASVEKWSQMIRSLWTFAGSDPKGFVRKFIQLDPKIRIPLIRFFRGGDDFWNLQYYYFAERYHQAESVSPFGIEHNAPLLNYMDGLDPKKIIVKDRPLNSSSQNDCLPENVNLPTCHDVRYCQRPLLVLKNQSTCRRSESDSKGQSKEERLGMLHRQQNSAQSLGPQGDTLVLSQRDIVELTLLSSGGLQLWNERTLRQLEETSRELVAGGVFPKPRSMGRQASHMAWIQLTQKIKDSKSGLIGTWERANQILERAVTDWKIEQNQLGAGSR